MIEGVTIRDLIVRTDERGSLTELLSVNMGDEDLCHVYVAMARPGVVKGFHLHARGQADRFVCLRGTAKIGMVDLRGPVRDDEIGLRWSTNEWIYLGADDPAFDVNWPCDRDWYKQFGGISGTYRQHQTVILEEEHPQLLTIPPGVAHGQMALEGRSVILNAPNRPFCRVAPDELRIPADSFGFVWPVENK